MKSVRKLSIFIPLLFVASSLFAQTYQWAKNIGGGNEDLGSCVSADNNGFVYVAGYFQGTNVDFDPSPSTTSFLSSNAGSRDGFIAKYTSTGNFVWAFKIGGANKDVVQAVSTDAAGNVFVTGYFRGNNVDFDPGTGSALLSSNGDGGSDPGYGGDIFVAKYSSAGQYVWAFNIGGTLIGDAGITIANDAAGNVYTGGYFGSTADFDPSPSGTQVLNGASGTAYMAKYDVNGQYQWAFNYGLGNGNNSPFGMKVDAAGNVYTSGYFTGTNMDFNPSPTATNNLSSNGNYEIFVSKYNTNGQYEWAFSIGGTNLDVGRDIEIDPSGNVYVVGEFNGNNIDFDPSPTGTATLSSVGYDVFLAKYNNNGQYQWAKKYGGTGNDISWSLAYSDNAIYITGSFQNTINFSPTGVDNLTSNGANDFYMTKFDVNGNYICSFAIGGSGNDDAYRVDADNAGNLFVTGILSSANTDFNPSTSVTNNLSSNGASDIFLANYTWASNVLPIGTLTANTIACGGGGQGQLTFTATTGIGPFTIEYSNGVTTFTQTNVQSGVPFNLVPNPVITTTYTLLSIRGSERCAAVNYPSNITATITTSSPGSVDFSFSQDICNPKTIQFFNSSQGAVNFTWDFGNSTSNIGNANPTVTYANYGNYPVKLKIQTANGCLDSVTKNITVNLQQDNNLIATNDLSVCLGSGTSLNIQDTGLNHCWSPVTGISNINSATPTITPAATTTYYFTAQTLGANLVVNGNFSAGNTGFTSEYISASLNTAEGQYFIGNSPLAWNGGLTACTEHTTGTGQMMMVNGSPVAGSKIWTQTIPVTPNSNYAFSTWIQSLHATNPANVKFSINGNIIGNNITAGSVACQWSRFFATWNSGSSTTATISIVNNNTVALGNDFALDDISFSPVIMKQDSIKISVTTPPSITGSAVASTICEADSSQLNAVGAANFSWQPTTGLSNPNIANPKASPASTTTYTVSGYDVVGCAGTKTVTVTINPKPVITKSADANICKDSIHKLAVSAPNALSYSWLPVTGLNNASSNNPLASPSSTTNYIVTVTGTNGCSNKDSVLVTVLIKPTVQVRIDTAVCNKVPVVLTTTNTDATSFSWLPATGLSSTTSPNPIATPSISTQYIVTAMNGSCSATDTINLGIKQLPTITKTADTIICKTGTANLSVAGGATYAWTPVYALGNPSSGTTTANPDATIKYFVTVTGSNLCVNTDSIKVTVNPKPEFALQPVSATICKGDSVLLTASGGDLYGWVPNTNIVSATSAITKAFPSVATTYKVGITSSACKVTDTLSSYISLNGSLSTSVSSSNNIDCSHGQSTLQAIGGVNYTWDPAPGISNLNTPSPTVMPTQTTTYYVKVVDAKGCTGYDSVKVYVDFATGMSQYLLPTAFTPDGNGKNDCFGLKYWGSVTQLDFNIYSRWGQLVFHTNNPNDCWDGKLNGQPQDSGTFVYQIKAKTACGEIYRKGTVVLIR